MAEHFLQQFGFEVYLPRVRRHLIRWRRRIVYFTPYLPGYCFTPVSGRDPPGQNSLRPTQAAGDSDQGGESTSPQSSTTQGKELRHMAEPQVRLITNSTLTVWANAGRTHRYPCGDGLYFQARPTRASWVFRFRFGGARRAMGLGAFPEVAREKADRARLALREGRDPIAEQKAAATLAQAQERTTLRQEYIALRQKVTVLEQELAQQRAMAKRFLGNKAADVPSGKVTEFRKDKARLSGRSIATHFPTARHWPCDPPPQPLIPDEVPAGALQAIEKEWKVPFLNENVREALERLATDPRMLTEVWEKLPRDPDGLGLAEYSIIQSAVGAFGIFPLLRQNHGQESAQINTKTARTGKDINNTW